MPELVERRARGRRGGARARRPRVRERRRHGLARGHRARTHRSPRSRPAPACSAAHLFDGYEHFTPAPAAAFALDVVRRRAATTSRSSAAAGSPPGRPPPTGCRASSGPRGSRCSARESAGEVQTPVTGPCRARPARRRPGLVPAHQGGRAVASTSTSSPWSTATRWSTPCPPTEARGRRSCDGERGHLAQLGPHRVGATPVRVRTAGDGRCGAARGRGRRGIAGCASSRSAPATASPASRSRPACSST